MLDGAGEGGVGTEGVLGPEGEEARVVFCYGLGWGLARCRGGEMEWESRDVWI